MSGPRLGQGMPTNDGWVARELADIRREMRELRAARTLDASTVSPGGTLTINGNLNVDGITTLDGALTLANGATLTASGDIESANYVAGTSGWKLDGTTGNLEINDATIRGGIIGQDALTDPLEPASVNVTDFSNTFTGTMTSYLTHAVTVPSGFTQAQVHVTALVTATTSTFVAVNAKVTVNGTDSDLVETSATNAVAVAPVPFAILATGLSGSFNISVSAQIAGTMTASSGQVYLSASVLFLR